MSTAPTKKYFCMSNRYLYDQNLVLSRIGKKITCGTVSIGSRTQTYCKMMDDIKSFDAFRAFYADTVLVAETDQTDVKYTEVTIVPIK